MSDDVGCTEIVPVFQSARRRPTHLAQDALEHQVLLKLVPELDGVLRRRARAQQEGKARHLARRFG